MSLLRESKVTMHLAYESTYRTLHKMQRTRLRVRWPAHGGGAIPFALCGHHRYFTWRHLADSFNCLLKHVAAVEFDGPSKVTGA